MLLPLLSLAQIKLHKIGDVIISLVKNEFSKKNRIEYKNVTILMKLIIPDSIISNKVNKGHIFFIAFPFFPKTRILQKSSIISADSFH